MCSNSNTPSTCSLIKYYPGIILLVFESLSLYVPNSIMVTVYPFKVPLPPLMMCLEKLYLILLCS